ncbi:hypothetical protein DFH07DRAFT_779819 [Mycena maculata]|uniref:Uncharacterized protein n=1 Tax=Mycena maculata TaxID=230809 RepID=A0AAD7MY78_9AGAR|nr:hypothetical protein DFH07DRAFT_779819 [Mycena maculata]
MFGTIFTLLTQIWQESSAASQSGRRQEGTSPVGCGSALPQARPRTTQQVVCPATSVRCRCWFPPATAALHLALLAPAPASGGSQIPSPNPSIGTGTSTEIRSRSRCTLQRLCECKLSALADLEPMRMRESEREPNCDRNAVYACGRAGAPGVEREWRRGVLAHVGVERIDEVMWGIGSKDQRKGIDRMSTSSDHFAQPGICKNYFARTGSGPRS